MSASPGPGACSQNPFEKRIDTAQLEILEIKRRYVVMRAFLDEIEEVSKGKEFRIRHDILWWA